MTFAPGTGNGLSTVRDLGVDGLKVLVVDDNRHFRNLTRTVLQSVGIRQIEDASDGIFALQTLRDFKADLVILDWKMEPMDGIAFARRLRCSPDSPNPFIPILMVSGHADVSLVRQARDAGINEFLAKPISVKQLTTRIVAVLGKPRPFVRTSTFYGPDRRRRQIPFHGAEQRGMRCGHAGV